MKGVRFLVDVNQAFEEYKNLVFRLGLMYTKNVRDAEDVCQSVFLKLVEKKEQISQEAVKPWLITVTANLCKDRFRSFWHKKVQLTADEMITVRKDESELLGNVMQLRKTERVVIYLYYYEGYSTVEIGEILGISQTNVSTRLMRARKSLRSMLEENENDEI